MAINEDRSKAGRRNFLLSAAASAGALGLGAAPSAEAAESHHGLLWPSAFSGLARLRDYEARRASSYDRTGGNADFARVDPGTTTTLMDVSSPGMITHIWITINSREAYHLKKLVLRAYWDQESEPSIEAPVGDFFGLGLGDYFLYQSALTSVASIKALNAYFPMPFAKSARITVTNEGAMPAESFYYNIDYVKLEQPLADAAYFHAQYRQQAPCKGWTNDWKSNGDPLVNDKKNLSGEGNYVFLEAEGRGHFVGVTQAVLQNQEGWFGEGDDMIFIDGGLLPVINGTGTEDYYNGAWDFGAHPFHYFRNGAPFIADAEHVGGRYCLYRWHLEDPYCFKRSIKVTIEHGHANHRSDNYYSTAYWYQTEPHLKFPALPSVNDRIPRVYSVGGPGAEPAR